MKKFQVIENLLNLRDENGIQDLTLRTKIVFQPKFYYIIFQKKKKKTKYQNTIIWRQEIPQKSNNEIPHYVDFLSHVPFNINKSPIQSVPVEVAQPPSSLIVRINEAVTFR